MAFKALWSGSILISLFFLSYTCYSSSFQISNYHVILSATIPLRGLVFLRSFSLPHYVSIYTFFKSQLKGYFGQENLSSNFLTGPLDILLCIIIIFYVSSQWVAWQYWLCFCSLLLPDTYRHTSRYLLIEWINPSPYLHHLTFIKSGQCVLSSLYPCRYWHSSSLSL